MTPHNLPQNWQWVSIQSVCKKIIAGGDKPLSFSQEKTASHNIPIYANAVKDNGLYGWTTEATIQEPAITISARGTIGFVCPRFEPFFPIVRLLVAIPDKKVDLLFLSYALKYILPSGNGSSIPQLTIPKFKKLPIPLPPLEIQREIVEVLESKLEKIKEAKALLETSLQECETYRLSLLESAFSGNLTPHSQNWQWVKLGEICDTSSGGTPSRTQSSYWNGKIKWLKSGELNDGLIDNVGETITQEGLKYSSAKLLPIGTLLIAMYGATIGRLGILNIETSTNQAICAITPKEENALDTKFLFYFLFTSRPKMLQDSFGGAQKNISQTYLKKLPIPLPPLEIQREIVEILESKLEKIKEAKALLETSLQECETYRLSLLESAFAGELV